MTRKVEYTGNAKEDLRDLRESDHYVAERLMEDIHNVRTNPIEESVRTPEARKIEFEYASGTYFVKFECPTPRIFKILTIGETDELEDE